DNILVIDGSNNVKKVAALTNTNIYNSDGTITGVTAGNRTVTMGNNNLLFNSANGHFIFNPTGTGKMGIGTNAPYEKLDVLGNIYLTYHGNTNKHDASEKGTRRIGQKAGNDLTDGFSGLEFEVVPSPAMTSENAGIIKFYTWGSSISTNREVARIDPYGRLGIGINNPISALQVRGAVRADSLVLTNLATGAAADNILVIDGSNNVKKVAALTNTNIYNSDGSLTGTRRVTMGGNSLTFSGTNHIVLNASPAGNAMGIRFSDNDVQKWHIEKTSDNDLAVVQTNVAERLRFKAGGNVGIGTTTPTQKLSIGVPNASASATPDAITLGGTFSNTAGQNLKLRLAEIGDQVWGFGVSANQLDYAVPNGNSHVFYVNALEQMRINNNGNVGIGTTTPAQKLDVNGT
ncbi:MAG: hypothetical protein ACRCUS_01365, partial [Anaerovoracaceae bacterium]